MSADLYITQIHDPLRHRYQPLFDKAVRLRDPLQERLPWVQHHPSQRQVLQELAASAQEIVSHFHDAMYGQEEDNHSVHSPAGGFICVPGHSWRAGQNKPTVNSGRVHDGITERLCHAGRRLLAKDAAAFTRSKRETQVRGRIPRIRETRKDTPCRS